MGTPSWRSDAWVADRRSAGRCGAAGGTPPGGGPWSGSLQRLDERGLAGQRGGGAAALDSVGVVGVDRAGGLVTAISASYTQALTCLAGQPLLWEADGELHVSTAGGGPASSYGFHWAQRGTVAVISGEVVGAAVLASPSTAGCSGSYSAVVVGAAIYGG